MGRYRDPARPHTRREALRHSAVVALAVGTAYWFTQWPLPRMTSSNPDLDFYVIQPIIWIAVAVVAVYGWLRLADRPPVSRLLIGIGFLVGLFHVAVLVIAGVVASFGESPIAGSLANYPKNFLFIVTLLAGVETSRAYLLHAWRRVGRRTASAVVTLGFAAVILPAAQWTPFETLDRFYRTAGSRWLPALALSAAATLMAGLGGIGPSLSYRFALLGFEWFSPILPALRWPVVAILGTLLPFAAWRLLVNIYADTDEGEVRLGTAQEREPWEEPEDKWFGWLVGGVAGVIAIALVLFGTGIIGYRMLVIDGISMEPAYERGDVALIRDAPDPESLQVDDVIRFRRGDISIVHRIVAIERGSDGLVFTTQGDNVARADPPVTEDMIEGKVVFLLPGVGHVSLWMRGA